VRAQSAARAAVSPGVLRAGGIFLNLLRREVTVSGRTASLSAREFSRLKAFAGPPGQVLSRQELLSMAWGMNFGPRTNLVDVYVGYLRRKLGGPIIEAIRGQGTALLVQGQAGPRNGPHRHEQT
jgi:DNA-binding response OmpR family regulator